jgi:hypothetical protein
MAINAYLLEIGLAKAAALSSLWGFILLLYILCDPNLVRIFFIISIFAVANNLLMASELILLLVWLADFPFISLSSLPTAESGCMLPGLSFT